MNRDVLHKIRMKNRMLPLYEWVSTNNPAPERQYDKGWWDTIEFYYRLADTFPDCNASVISTYIIETPPPCEELLLPTVQLQLPTAKVVLQHDFEPLALYWPLAVKRQSHAAMDGFGLFDPPGIVPDKNLHRLPKAWRFRPMAKNPQRFCCLVEDEFHVFTLLWILSHGKPPTLQRKRR